MTDAAAIILWGHALAGLLFGALALACVRDTGVGLPRTSFIVALVLTALWALAVAGIDARDVSTRIAESLRNIAWFGFLYALLRQGESRRPGLAVNAIYAVVVLICAATAGLAIVEAAGQQLAFAATRLVLRMLTEVAGLVLVHQLATASAPATRGGVRLALAALAALWSVDLIVHATAWVGGGWPASLIAGRGIAVSVIAALFMIAIHRGGDWTLKLSRTVAFQSLSLAAIVAYVAAMVLATGLFAGVGGAHVRLVQTAFVAGVTATLIGIVASPWLRAWVKVKVAKHLFHHRYDYRHEWLRFTATLGQPDGGIASLEQRVVKAIADLTDSPAGLLLVADGDTLHPGGGWNWTGEGTSAVFGLAGHLATDRIVDLDMLRASPTAESALVPAWLFDRAEAWAIVPLIHLGRLAGAVVLARPPVSRALDWEDFDLLRVAGQQGASYLAEARAAAALNEAQRFDEFNRRFAFIIHDVKNLVSQLTLVARNAERHADNPAFRSDMIATLQDSCGRMSALLARLSQHSGVRADPPRPVEVRDIVQRIARRRCGQHPIVVTGGAAIALLDPVRFEQLLSHLIQNAVEASEPAAPVTVAVEQAGATVTVAVVDTGGGMTAAFIRDELFRPFTSSKSGGFGIGAFEARQLTEAMGGVIAVQSQVGGGTRFAVSFPAAFALEAAA